LKFADAACYEAKYNGRNQYKIYGKQDERILMRTEQMNWLSRINLAFEENKFVLFAQIIVPTNPDSSLKKSYEILIRIKENGQLIPPGLFLPAAERYDQMIAIDRWVVKNTIDRIKNEAKFLDEIDHVSINLSCQSLSNNSFLNFLVGEISDADLSEKICLEITETAVINNLSQVKKAILILHGMGVRFSLDDFGSGLSSFAYLKNLNVDYLKIDGMFVKNIIKIISTSFGRG